MAIIIVTKMPIASTNKNTATLPNNSPVLSAGLRILDAVQTVDRREEQVLDPVLEGQWRFDLLITALDWAALIVGVVLTGRNHECQQPDHDGDQREDRVRAGEGPDPLFAGVSGRLLPSHCGPCRCVAA